MWKEKAEYWGKYDLDFEQIIFNLFLKKILWESSELRSFLKWNKKNIMTDW